MTSNPFTGKVLEYEEYEETPRGRFRSALLLWQIQNWLDQNSVKTILDFGCGTGALAVNLAKKGFEVTALDPDQGMLEATKRKAVFLRTNLHTLQGNLDDFDNLFAGQKFDFIIAHSVLEFLPDPQKAINKLSSLLTDNGFLSVETKNAAASVFYNTLMKHDFAQAKKEFFSRSQKSKLVGVKMQTFLVGDIEKMFKEASLKLQISHGVRIFFDYLVDTLPQDKNKFDQLLDLEKTICFQHPYNAIGRYIHLIAQK